MSTVNSARGAGVGGDPAKVRAY